LWVKSSTTVRYLVHVEDIYIEMSNLYRLIIPYVLLSAIVGCQHESAPQTQAQIFDMPIGVEVRTIWCLSPDSCVVAGRTPDDFGAIIHTCDQGATWVVDTVVSSPINELMYDATGQGYCCGEFGNAYFNDPNNPSWVEYRNDFRRHTALYYTSPRAGVIVSGESWGIGQTRTFGPDYFWWMDNLQDHGNELMAVWACTPDIWVAGGVGWVLRSTDAGRTWVRLQITDAIFDFVQFPTPDRGYLGAQDGSLYTSDDQGATWQRVRKGSRTNHGHPEATAWWFAPDGVGWQAHHDGTITHTTDGGHTWHDWAHLPDGTHVTDLFAVEISDSASPVFYALWAATESGQVIKIIR
jgi:photosystem II stability/assembly factor-like uncharacterized protein